MDFGLPTLTYNRPEPPAPPRPEDTPRPNEDVAAETKRRDAAFDDALKAQLDRELPALMPMTMPWLLNQAQPRTEGTEQVIEAATAVAPRVSAPMPVWTPPVVMPSLKATGEPIEIEVAPAVESAMDREDAPTEVAVVVEAGLPIAQPTISHTDGPVPLADFPQVVVGQVKQMTKDNQPVTQLDFEISPPHVGPVNLQISLQNGAVNVQLVALTMQAKQALESQVGSIHTILQAHNLQPGQVKIVTAAGGRTGAGGAGQKGDQPSGFGLLNGGRKRSGGNDDVNVQS
jgi:flagellar hook-length control protein FliK